MGTTNDYWNAVIAYILAGGDDSDYGAGYYSGSTYSARQLALWNNWNNFVSINSTLKSNYTDSADSNIDNESAWTTAAADLQSEAYSYATNYTASGYTAEIEASSTSVKLDAYDTDDDYIGPFKVTYTGTISSYTVYDSDGNALSTSSYSFYTKSSSGTYSKASSIPNGLNFYVKVSDYNISKITINVKANNPYFYVRFYIMECSRIQTDGIYDSTSQIQDLIKIQSRSTGYETDSVTIYVSIDKPR